MVEGTPSAAPSLPADRLGAWMSAALDDPKVCDAMKADIQAWFASGQGATMTADVVALVKATKALIDACGGNGPVTNEARAALAPFADRVAGEGQ